MNRTVSGAAPQVTSAEKSAYSVIGGASTATQAMPWMHPAEAVMVAVPGASAVKRPQSSIDPTHGSLQDQVNLTQSILLPHWS
ncbi:hypothetical protein DSECCO2_625930 [anaerobic digester metagenome]